MQVLRREFNGIYIGNNGYDLALALAARQHRSADLIAFGGFTSQILTSSDDCAPVRR